MNIIYQDDSDTPLAVYNKGFYEVHEHQNIRSNDGTIGMAYSARGILFDDKTEAERYAKTGKFK